MYYSAASSDLRQPVPVLWVLATLFLALAAEFIPWPALLLPFRPLLPMLALVYWVVHQPRVVNYAAALAVGVILDLANQTPMGFNAAACVAVVLLTNMLSNRFMLLAGMAQALHVLLVLAAGQLCLYLLGFLEAQAPPPLEWRLFWPSVASAALWLLLPLALRQLRQFISGRRYAD